MALETWVAFALAAQVVLLIPGPTILLVVAYSLSHGRMATVPLVIGVGLGDLTAMMFSFVGLDVLLQTVAAFFAVFKWAGAAYLVYLGIQLWRTPPQPLDALVVDLALRYFVADGWRRAAQVNDWTKVTGVSAELLVASPQDGLVDTASSYVFDGDRVTASDHRLYRVYTTAVALRNALHPHEEGAS